MTDVEVLLTGEHIPAYAHPGDGGADLVSVDTLELGPGERAMVGTGTAVALPDGYVGLVVPRSGLAIKHGLTIVNTPGILDAGYRGEIKIILLNTDRSTPYTVTAGDRIAQLVVLPVSRARFVPVDRLPGSHRGEDGFGSTGYANQGATA